jgi:FAD/FMN-containing dehydrogenase
MDANAPNTSLVAAPSPTIGERPRGRGEWVEGWGRLGRVATELRSEDLGAVAASAHLTRGLGRSYGDSAIPAVGDALVAGSVLADRILAFDESTGVLRAEAGLSLAEINRLFMPRGFFTPVTPGTKFVTLGGMVASDVHGKNHHVALTFGEHVEELVLRVADGRVLACSPTQHADLFDATIGGMGLTGHILEVSFRMERIPSPWIFQHSMRVPNIDAYIDALKDSAARWPMTVGWIDCVSRGNNLGRGILMCGRWATADEAPRHAPPPKRRITMPDIVPSWALNKLSVRAFNELYYWKHVAKEKTGIVHPESFFYPLDAIHAWNRMYGRRGFTQYQCVLPTEAGRGAARRFLELLTSLGGASFLCVIKDCGAQGRGLLSFPMPGISIALDIPIRDNIQTIVDRLNELVIAEGGRIYLTKDTFTRPEHFAAMEGRLGRFNEVRRRWDPDGLLRSAQSVRLLDSHPPALTQEIP